MPPSLGSTSGKLIAAFVALILGAVLIGSISTNTLDVTQRLTVTNETVNYNSVLTGAGTVNGSAPNVTVASANVPTGYEVQDCNLESFTALNGSGTALVSGTDYNIDLTNGQIGLINTTSTQTTGNVGNDTLVSYTHCPNDYINVGWGRNILLLAPGFFALAILGIGIGLFYSLGKDHGII
jgi:hypothetical protein|tara:strand:- start:3095 stop:3637 length:543 start_codon:yes stop_codon:yes gene_type:complete